MRSPISIPHLTTKAKYFALAGALVIATSSVAAYNTLQPTSADEMTPTDVKVQDHDQRLDKAESDITETKDRVSNVEQKTEENTQAIGQVQQRVTVVEGKSSSPATAPVADSAPAQSVPAPVAAAPQVNPRIVTSMSSEEKFDKFGTSLGWQCNYTLANGKSYSAHQGYACHAVGTEISGDLAITWGVK